MDFFPEKSGLDIFKTASKDLQALKGICLQFSVTINN